MIPAYQTRYLRNWDADIEIKINMPMITHRGSVWINSTQEHYGRVSGFSCDVDILATVRAIFVTSLGDDEDDMGDSVGAYITRRMTVPRDTNIWTAIRVAYKQEMCVDMTYSRFTLIGAI